MERLERILGGIFGVACGDALGCTLEFIDSKAGMDKYGYLKEIIGGGLMNLKEGDVTDDTMMTIAVAKGIIANPKSPNDEIGEYFIKWYDTKPKDVGNTVNLALSYYKRHKSFEESALYAHNMMDGKSAGNGSLMRCIPPALYYRDIEKVIEVSVKQSFLTHYDRKAADACVIYNTMVFRYMNGEDKDTVINDVLSNNMTYRRAITMKKDELTPSGYVVDTLLCALWCFIHTDNFEEAVCEAVNLYGDPDTIGAIAGGLAGVYYGYESIPKRWRDKILLKDELREIAEKLSQSEAH